MPMNSIDRRRVLNTTLACDSAAIWTHKQLRAAASMMIALSFFLTVGCTSFQPKYRSIPPAVLQGSNSDIRERLLREIPIGTNRDDAERLVKSATYLT